MNRFDMKYKRLGMGLPQTGLADVMEVNQRTVRRWESGDYHIIPPVADKVNRMYYKMVGEAGEIVDSILDALPDGEPRSVEVSVYETRESHEQAHPGESWEYHQALSVMVGVLLAAEGLQVEFVPVATEPTVGGAYRI